MNMVEKVATIIDPYAFKHRDNLFRFCIGRGDSEEEAHKTADWAHGAQCKEAMTKSRAAIEAMKEPTKDMLAAVDQLDMSFVGEQAPHDVAWSTMITAALSEESTS